MNAVKTRTRKTRRLNRMRLASGKAVTRHTLRSGRTGSADSKKQKSLKAAIYTSLTKTSMPSTYQHAKLGGKP